MRKIKIQQLRPQIGTNYKREAQCTNLSRHRKCSIEVDRLAYPNMQANGDENKKPVGHQQTYYLKKKYRVIKGNSKSTTTRLQTRASPNNRPPECQYHIPNCPVYLK